VCVYIERGIFFSPQNGMTEKLLVQTLIGRILADDMYIYIYIYIGSRCIAASLLLAGAHLGSINYVMGGVPLMVIWSNWEKL
jgi:hypothetical protein